MQAASVFDSYLHEFASGNPFMDELVIARYSEDLSWIRDVPGEYSVVIYNKGKRIANRSVIGRAAAIYDVPNVGRESESYLRHILTLSEKDEDFTVFCQGDPFDHSPDFLSLLSTRHGWLDLQPLSWCYTREQNIPPANLLDQERSDFLGALRIRKEIFSLYTMAPVHFVDKGAENISEKYRKAYRLAPGTNVVADFLVRCDFSELADQARRHLLGTFSYGAILGIRNRLLRAHSEAAYLRLREVAEAEGIHGWMFERIWLHLWGEPFVLPLPNGSAADGAESSDQRATIRN